MEDLIFIIAVATAALAADGGLEFPFFKDWLTRDRNRATLAIATAALIILGLIL